MRERALITDNSKAIFDVLVVGAGPAGLTLAAECARLGLWVGCLDRDFNAEWPAHYGVWMDEWRATRFGEFVTHTWDKALYIDNNTRSRLSRSYGRVDRKSWRRALMEEIKSHDGVLMRGSARAVTRRRELASLQLERGGEISARVVVDACGYTPFTDKTATLLNPELAWQSGWGERIRVSSAPSALFETFTFMDYRAPEGGGELWSGTPTFLYAMPLSDDEIFVEETVLAARPEVPLERLRDRLAARLAWMGVKVEATLESERGRIPMNLTLPEPNTHYLRWGAAAGMLHQATGYMVAAMARLAPSVAKAIRREIDLNGSVTKPGMLRLWDEVWPSSLRKARDLHSFGLDEVLTMNREEIGEFFGSFFRLPIAHWSSYLDGAATHRDVTASMFRLLLHSPAGVQARLLKAGFRRPRALITSSL